MKDFIVLNDFNQWNQWYKDGRVKIKDTTIEETFENQPVLVGDGEIQGGVGLVKGDELVKSPGYFPCDIAPKNEQQEAALAILKDNSIQLKIMSGVAGSGKTLLACAHAMEQLVKDRKSKIVIAKSMTPVGREVGFLKGDMFNKVRPWLGPFYDNIVECGIAPYELDDYVHSEIVEITPITFIQGRSISNSIIIIDEAQNLSMDVLKQIITRTASDSQIILLGDQSQVFEKLRTESLTELTNRGKNTPLVGSVEITKSFRSPIAAWAIDNL